jgi:hypothetical protein
MIGLVEVVLAVRFAVTLLLEDEFVPTTFKGVIATVVVIAIKRKEVRRANEAFKI